MPHYNKKDMEEILNPVAITNGWTITGGDVAGVWYGYTRFDQVLSLTHAGMRLYVNNRCIVPTEHHTDEVWDANDPKLSRIVDCGGTDINGILEVLKEPLTEEYLASEKARWIENGKDCADRNFTAYHVPEHKEWFDQGKAMIRG